jgi:putative nucleotidyltransferase with HDIG domain
MQTVEEFLDKVEYLPPIPRNLVQLLDLLNRVEVDAEQVVRHILYDPSLTANVMRLCNSAYFASASPVTDLQEAVMRLGFNEVCQLVVALGSARALVPAQKGYGIEEGELWRHSVTVALASKFMALDREDNPSVVFTAAILHDLGKIVMAKNLEHSYAAIMRETEENHLPMTLVEKKLVGFDHTEVGGCLLERWQFPPDLVAAVRHHHDPSNAGDHVRIASYVYLGNMIACFMGYGCGYQTFAMDGRTEALENLGIESRDLPHCMIRTFDSLQDMQMLLDFPNKK